MNEGRNRGPHDCTGLTSEALVRAYLCAKRVVIEAGFASEIIWQRTRRIADLTPNSFLEEAAWVILSSGMRESVIRGIFPQLSHALHFWNPSHIVGDSGARVHALSIFGHVRKVDAILEAARVADELHADSLREILARDPECLFARLPYVGPVTGRHLAKNLGIPVAKPDRHLVRLVRTAQRDSVDLLCKEISDQTSDPVPVVDIVLWRWGALHRSRCDSSRCDGVPHVLI